jgi:hypothetical protein
MRSNLEGDFEASFKRYEAYWNQSVIDRPLIAIPVRPRVPLLGDQVPDSPSWEAQWLDIDRRVERDIWVIENTAYYGDALPIAWPNMGPEIFSAWCGAGYQYGKMTTWSVPSINSWAEDGPGARLDLDHPLFRRTAEYTDRLIERSDGRFIVGLTDFHPGGDHLAALRDPERLALDLIENPEWVKKMVDVATTDFFVAYDFFYDRIRAAGMPVTSWIPLVAEGKYYIPSNDFSALISPQMFEEFFLEGIREECRFLDRSIYHLDGPDAVRHLDLLLEIPELDAIQFQPGAGSGSLERWLPVYRRIQDGGKATELEQVKLHDLDAVFEALKPEGVFINRVNGVENAETAAEVLKRVERWT